MEIFKYWERTIQDLLPPSWREEISSYALGNYKDIVIVPTSVTSRESSSKIKIPVKMIDGEMISRGLPWLCDLYENQFLQMIKTNIDSSAISAKNKLHGVTINVQTSDMRYECHVESNPITALLYVNDHPKGTGGELVVSNDTNAVGIENAEKDSVKIYPKSGHLYVIEALNNPHYTMPIERESNIRISIVMNYYNKLVTEDDRPGDLDGHLGLL